jgi:hypothetical protein
MRIAIWATSEDAGVSELVLTGRRHEPSEAASGWRMISAPTVDGIGFEFTTKAASR